VVEGIIRKHYEALFDESNGYKKIYDVSSPETPDWVDSKNTEFLRTALPFGLKTGNPDTFR
jgi:hypothetical protein